MHDGQQNMARVNLSGNLIQFLSVIHSTARAHLRHERMQNGEVPGEDLDRLQIEHVLDKDERVFSVISDQCRQALSGSDLDAKAGLNDGPLGSKVQSIDVKESKFLHVLGYDWC